MLLLLYALSAAPPAPPAEPLVVTTAWLAQHLHDRGLVIFQIGDRTSRPAYDEGHIPGAQFLNPFSELAAPRVDGALALELPAPEALDSVLESKGLSNDSRVVLYWAKEYFSPTSRTLFTLEYAGLAGRVSILDGGLEVWKSEGRAVSTEVPTPARGSFTVRPGAGLVADAGYVKDHLKDPAVRIVDARDSAFFNGRETRQGRNGHIPGAASIPFGTMVDSGGKFLTPVQLKASFAAAGVRPGQTVVTYCHIGQQATLVWFVARYLGYDAKLYDGSFQDWAARTDLPVDNPAPPADSMVVSAAWLTAHRTDPHLVILHASMEKADYEREHVSGARWLDPHALIASGAPGIELPSVEHIDSVLESLGVTDQSHIVYYGDTWMAPRIYLALDYAGLGDRTGLLDGGLGSFKKAGGLVSNQTPTWTRGGLTTRARPEIRVSADWLGQHLDDPSLVLVDGRSPGEYAGTDESERLPRFGHIPGGVNLPWEKTFTDPAAALDGTPSPLIPREDLRRLLQGAGAGPNKQIVTVCTVGLRASHLYFIARYLGWYTRIYDGSMSEWSRKPELPMVRGSSPR